MLKKTRRDLKIHERRKHANPWETIYEELEGNMEKKKSKFLRSYSLAPWRKSDFKCVACDFATVSSYLGSFVVKFLKQKKK